MYEWAESTWTSPNYVFWNFNNHALIRMKIKIVSECTAPSCKSS
jgi:hypothetical protein